MVLFSFPLMAILGLPVLITGDTAQGWRRPSRFQIESILSTTRAASLYNILQQRVLLIEQNVDILQFWSQACLRHTPVHLEMVRQSYSNSVDFYFDGHSFQTVIHGVRIELSAIYISNILNIPLVSNPQFSFGENFRAAEYVVNWELMNGSHYSYPV
ncbi:hypothetical protein U1Q18_010010 [Sarracenia purpurea var. burkii]